MPQSENISIEEIKQCLEKQNLIYSKYAVAVEGIQEALIHAILEWEKELGFTKNKRAETIQDIEKLTAGLFEYLTENADDIESPKY